MMEPVLLFIWPEFVGKSITIAAIVKGKCTLNSRTGIGLLNNKFHGLSPSGGFASLLFDQGVPKKLPTTAPSSQSEHHLMVFCINQIVPGFVVYHLNSLRQ
jgi:hypothetical protein